MDFGIRGSPGASPPQILRCDCSLHFYLLLTSCPFTLFYLTCLTVRHITLMFEWTKQHFRRQDKCVHAVKGNWIQIACKWSSVLVGLWIQVSNVSLGCDGWRGWLGQRALVRLRFHYVHSWWNFIRSEFSWSGSIHFLGQRNSSPHPPCKRAGLLPLTGSLSAAGAKTVE